MPQRNIQQGQQSLWQVGAFTSVFLLLALGAIAFFLNAASERENVLARAQSINLANTAVETFSASLSARLYDFSWWDEMAQRAAREMDPEWANDNIGLYLEEDFGYSGSYLIGSNSQISFLHRSDDSLPSNPLDFFGDGAADYFESFVRTTYEYPEIKVAFVKYDGQVYELFI